MSVFFFIKFLQSERSADMFCDDIFGESPAGVRKPVMPVHFLFFNHIPCSVVAIFPFIVDPLPTTKKV